MHTHTLNARERISTQAGAMDLDAGRLLLADAVKAFFISASAWVFVCAGLLLVRVSWGGDRYEHVAVATARWFFATLGGGLAALALAAAVSTMFLLVRGWFRYARRLEEWHRVQLWAYTQAGGQQVDRTLTIKSMTAQEPAHVLLAALALAARVRAGDVTEPSVSALQGAVWLNFVQVGELTKPGAEEMLRAFSQVGLIRGRTKGRAGQLVTLDPAEILELVTTRAGRIKAPAPELPEPLQSGA